MASEYPSMGDLSRLPAALAGQAQLAARPPAEGLPPGVERDPERGLIRRLPMVSADGSPWEQVRFVALTLAEARKDHKDYYHPDLGWVRDGRKLERDRKPQDIMADKSLASPDPAV